MSHFYQCSHGTLLILWVGITVAATVCGLIIYSTASFRKSSNTGSAPYLHSTTVEIAWVLIPIVILVLTAMPAINTLIAIESHCSVASGLAVAR